MCRLNLLIMMKIKVLFNKKNSIHFLYLDNFDYGSENLNSKMPLQNQIERKSNQLIKLKNEVRIKTIVVLIMLGYVVPYLFIFFQNFHLLIDDRNTSFESI